MSLNIGWVFTVNNPLHYYYIQNLLYKLKQIRFYTSPDMILVSSKNHQKTSNKPWHRQTFLVWRNSIYIYLITNLIQ